MNKTITKKHIDYILFPKDGDMVQVLDDCWWVITKENEVLFYGNYDPQCNKDKRIVDKFIHMYPECEPRLVARAYIPINPKDFC